MRPPDVAFGTLMLSDELDNTNKSYSYLNIIKYNVNLSQQTISHLSVEANYSFRIFIVR